MINKKKISRMIGVGLISLIMTGNLSGINAKAGEIKDKEKTASVIDIGFANIVNRGIGFLDYNVNLILKSMSEDSSLCNSIYKYRIGASGNSLNKLLKDTAEIKDTLNSIDNKLDTMEADLLNQSGQTQSILREQAVVKEEDDIWDVNKGIINIGIVKAEKEYENMLQDIDYLCKQNASKDTINETQNIHMKEIIKYLGISVDGTIKESYIDNFSDVIEKLNYEVVNLESMTDLSYIKDETKMPIGNKKSCYVSATYEAAKQRYPFSHQIYDYEKYIANKVILQQGNLLSLYKECADYLSHSDNNEENKFGVYMNDKYTAVYNMTINAANNVLMQVEEMNLMNPSYINCTLQMEDGSIKEFYRVKMNYDGKIYYISKDSYKLSEYIDGLKTKNTSSLHTNNYLLTNKFYGNIATKGNTAVMPTSCNDLSSLFGENAGDNNYYNKPESFLKELGGLKDIKTADYILMNNYEKKTKTVKVPLPYGAGYTEETNYYVGSAQDFSNYKTISIDTKSLSKDDRNNKMCKIILKDKSTSVNKTITSKSKDKIKLYKEETYLEKSILKVKRTEINSSSKLNAGDTIVASVEGNSSKINVSDEKGKSIEAPINSNNEYIFKVGYENIILDNSTK